MVTDPQAKVRGAQTNWKQVVNETLIQWFLHFPGGLLWNLDGNVYGYFSQKTRTRHTACKSIRACWWPFWPPTDENSVPGPAFLLSGSNAIPPFRFMCHLLSLGLSHPIKSAIQTLHTWLGFFPLSHRTEMVHCSRDTRMFPLKWVLCDVVLDWHVVWRRRPWNTDRSEVSHYNDHWRQPIDMIHHVISWLGFYR